MIESQLFECRTTLGDAAEMVAQSHRVRVALGNDTKMRVWCFGVGAGAQGDGRLMTLSKKKKRARLSAAL